MLKKLKTKCFPTFKDDQNFQEFINDFNKLPLMKKQFIKPFFYNYKILLNKTINKLQAENYSFELIFDNTVSKEDEGFVRYYFPNKQNNHKVFDKTISDLKLPDISLDNSLTSQQLGLKLTPYSSSKNNLETYCHEIIHSIDYMLGVLLHNTDSYLSSKNIPDDTFIEIIPDSIFSYFSSFPEYQNLVTHTNHGEDLYKYGALMDIMSIFSLGDFFYNYLKNQNVELNKKVNYGHNHDTFLVKNITNPQKGGEHKLPDIATEQIANYICMKIFSPKAYKIFKKEYPEKVIQYNKLISIMKNYIKSTRLVP